MTSPAIDAVVKTARSQIGYIEGVNNDNKFGVWFKMNHVSWCAIFVSWVFVNAGVPDRILKSASCMEIEAWALKNKLIVPIASIQAGDVLLHDFARSGKSEHVDIATGVFNPKTQSVMTCGGNTSSGAIGSQANGDGVYEKPRFASTIRYAIRPKYQEK